jgi:propionate CoA-transferase
VLGAVAAEERVLEHLTLTTEPGVIGGMPKGGLDFGAAVNTQALLHQNQQFDFYDGGGLDLACLGMAQTDRAGNVNVSRFGPRLAGSGGFINISQNARRVVFAGTFTAGGLEVLVQDGGLRIVTEGRKRKFVEAVEQITFSGERAAATAQPVLYVTERCVLTVSPKGLQLIEIAPGIDLGRDILAHMDFTPVIDGPVTMDPRLFRPEPMGLKAQFLDAPIEARITFDSERDLLVVNLRGYRVRTLADLEAIADRCAALVAPLGRKVDMVAWYDGFTLDPALDHAYADMVARMEKRFYRSSVRYTRDPFTRLRFGAELAKRDVSMRLRRDAILTGAT